MIKTTNLTKRYPLPGKMGFVTALNRVSLEIKEGEIYGLVGPNGAGKTTLLKTIAGLLIPEKGTVSVNGKDIIEDREQVRGSIEFLMSSGWIIFDYKLPLNFNLKYWGVMQGLGLNEAEKKAEEVLKLIGLGEYADASPENLSAGMRQKLNIARILLTEKPIYLLDEPTTGLDAVSANFTRNFIKKNLKKHDRTIIMATHNLWEAEELCDRIGILNKGKLLFSGTIAELKKKHGKKSLEQIFMKLVGGTEI
ncbi:TPA: ABC transporter ATP-binding protein [archaeon]|uniref:ABC transporter ATP-binding protein n=1 Tax=Candidatus Naiadarchaeum limnaeum TaxID=2756139 RepID=A0A832XH29_9ARCH|nr:ABC transporter ATP-binding protein [Candidatus Naiadarchaeum limnaeum]